MKMHANEYKTPKKDSKYTAVYRKELNKIMKRPIETTFLLKFAMLLFAGGLNLNKCLPFWSLHKI